MRRHQFAPLAAILLLIACTNSDPEETQVISVYASSAASPWLEGVYDCVPSTSAVAMAVDPDAELILRLGEPLELEGPAYQIGADDLLVVVHPQNGVGPLTLSEVEALFAGQFENWSAVRGADLPVQVWAFSPDVDIQLAFDRAVMHGRPVTSLARLAVTAQQMSDAVGAAAGSIGLLPRRWKTGNTREALDIDTLPVLAITRFNPEGDLANLVSCLQTGTRV